VSLLFFFLSEVTNLFIGTKKDAAWHASQEIAIAQVIKAGDIKACDAVAYKGLDGTDYSVVCKGNIAYSNAISKLDASYCAQLSPSFLDPKICEEEVLFQKLSVKNDATVCNEVADPILKSDCMEVYFLNETIKTGNSSLCSKIENDYRKTRCFDEISALPVIAQKKSLNCSLVPDIVKDDCEILKTLSTKTSAERGLCSQIKNIVLQNRCFSGN
jgi:hypothetical protein